MDGCVCQPSMQFCVHNNDLFCATNLNECFPLNISKVKQNMKQYVAATYWAFTCILGGTCVQASLNKEGGRICEQDCISNRINKCFRPLSVHPNPNLFNRNRNSKFLHINGKLQHIMFISMVADECSSAVQLSRKNIKIVSCCHIKWHIKMNSNQKLKC